MNKEKICLYITWILSCATLLFSLYFSEIKHFHPCTLCWYQRISLFPMVIILGVAVYKEFLGIFPYVISFPVLGLIFSAWQVAMQEFPNLHLSANCAPQISCATKVMAWGWVSLPILTLICCIVMIILLCLSRVKRRT